MPVSGAQARFGVPIPLFETSGKCGKNNAIWGFFGYGTVSAKFLMPGGSGVDQGCIRIERGMLEPNPVRGSVVLAYCRQTACRDVYGAFRDGVRPSVAAATLDPLDVILPRTLVQPLPGALFRSGIFVRYKKKAQCTSATASPWGRNCWDSSSQSLNRFSSLKRWRSR